MLLSIITKWFDIYRVCVKLELQGLSRKEHVATARLKEGSYRRRVALIGCSFFSPNNT